MIPRFSLYGDPAVWRDNIQEDPDGRWVHWAAVEPYVRYCREQGLCFDQPIPPPKDIRLTDRDYFPEDITIDELEEDEFEDDEDEDTVDYMEKNT